MHMITLFPIERFTIRAALIQIICGNIHTGAGGMKPRRCEAHRAGDPPPLRSALTSSAQSPLSPGSLSVSVSCQRPRRHERFTPPLFRGIAIQPTAPAAQRGGRNETGGWGGLRVKRVERLSAVPLGGASARAGA